MTARDVTDGGQIGSVELKTVSLCKTPLPYIALRHTLPLFYPTPCMSSPYSIPLHACPPPILSQSVHTLPLFYPTPCMSSPYSIPTHAHPTPILSQPMHTLPLFYPTPCMPSRNSIPAHVHPPPILFHFMHAFSLCYSILCMPSPYSLPAHTSHPSIPFHCMPNHACPSTCNSLSHTPWRHVSPLTWNIPFFESAHTEYIILFSLTWTTY